jgi:hypothetical protein
MKTLQEICLANPLKVRIARVHFECTSDYDHYAGRRDAKMYINYPLEEAVNMWKHPLEFVEKREVIHKYTNDGLLREAANEMASQTLDSIKALLPDIETLIYNGLEAEARDGIKRGEVSRFIHTEVEHQTFRISHVYIPGYHAEYGGQAIDVEPEVLWQNPNY